MTQTDREKVRAVWPDAHIVVVRTTQYRVVRAHKQGPMTEYRELGYAKNAAAAWADAAKKLGKEPA